MVMTLRFGFLLFPYSRLGEVEEVAEAVCVAEQLGFSSCVLPHHLLPPRWHSAAPAGKVWHDPLILGTFLAARTSTLLLRTGVLVLPYLQPVPLAKAVATLDILSSGRFRLGVGVGWMRAEFRRLGIRFEERAAITEETVRAMRELWESEAPSFSGRYVQFDDVSFLPRPTSARIPIDFGGGGPHTFRRVAELGDGWYPLSLTPNEIAFGVLEIKRLFAAAGRDPDQLVVSSRLVIDTGDPETATMADHVGAEGGRGASTASAAVGPRSLSGVECVDAIEQLRSAGVTDVMVEFAWDSTAELVDRLVWFADAVMPVFA
jgi:probable F420-dependent oxidoreductase